MVYGHMNTARMKALAGAIFLGMSTFTSIAYAGTTLVGGGATLPMLGYVGDVTHRQQMVATPNSFFGVFSAQADSPLVSYCQNGSGMGKNVLTGYSPGPGVVSVQSSCPDGNITPTGFGAALVGRADLIQPNFVASESPLSNFDYINYIANRPRSQPVQFPAVAGSIAITFNKASVNSLALTDALVCKIFSRKITDWSDTQLAAAGVPAGVSGPINVVYSSDGSGTTFGFSNHLTAVCGGTPSQHFVTDQTFTKVVAQYLPTLPNTWIGQSGDENVVNAVLNTDGAIGYAGSADVVNALGLFATINGTDPIVDFGDPSSGRFTINSADLIYNELIAGTDSNSGQAVFVAVSPPLGTNCIALVKPAAYAVPSASSSYPIVAISYLLGNSNGNGSDTTNVRNLFGAPYNGVLTGSTNLTTIGAGTGIGFLNTSIVQQQISNCIVN
jgi:phosphate transport system substrate-binding protein